MVPPKRQSSTPPFIYMGQITWCLGIHYAWMPIPYKPMNDLSETYPKIIQAYAYAPHQNGDVDV